MNEIENSKEEIIKERGNKLIETLKKPTVWVIISLVLLIILGTYIRIQPMRINPGTGNPGLWDITTDTWTLGPDLDPWLFTRHAQTIIKQGGLPPIDTMRNVPLGLDTSIETQLLPNMIAWTYRILNIFTETTLIYAAVIFPVIMFSLTVIAFFLFVREIFIRKSKKSKITANIISLISTLFMVVIPALLPRTIAGIPEKESAAFFFLFLTFYLFLKAWKSEKTRNYVILSILAGISTAALGAIWGGVLYAFITIALATLSAFIINKIHKKEFIVYFLWVASSFGIMILMGRLPFRNILQSLDTLAVSLVLFILIVHFIIWNTIGNLKILNNKIPKNIISLIISIILGVILILLMLGPSFFIQKIQSIGNMLFSPTTGRWNRTVAENSQPFFTGWGSSFGPFIGNMPIVFWLFFVGSVVLFKKMLNGIKKKSSLILTGLYIFFFCGIVFSRYSSAGMLNGVNFISKLFYMGSAVFFIGFLIYFYLKGSNRDRESNISFEYIFLFSLFVLCLIAARSAVRLIMVLAPIAPIFIGYLVVEAVKKARKSEDVWKIMFVALAIVIILASVFAVWTFYKQSKGQARQMIPSYYNQQWQKAMEWTREETPQDAVLASWWDYGYWIQSIGNRATVTDGGNAISFWNYWTGRMVLTGDNQKDALDFLYTHETDYFLIDSSDIGKYGAFSSIGSNENYDRLSWIGTFLLDESQVQETSNGTNYVYVGGVALDEDIIIEENGRQILLPQQSAGVGGLIISSSNEGNMTRASAAIFYQGNRHDIPLRYVYINGEIVDFGSGIEAVVFIFPKIIQTGGGLQKSEIGAAMFISPRLLRGMLSQVYIMNDPFNNFEAFELAHSEPNRIIQDFNNQGANLPEFLYFNGLQGPIKIWEIKYTGEEEFKQKYLDRDASKYLNWSL